MRTSYASSLLVLALFVSPLACASPTEEDGAASQDAISHQEAAAQLDVKEWVLHDVAASQESTATLGIKKWQLYSRMTQDFNGVIAFATDANEDVKYALIIDAKTGKTAIVKYDRNGVEKGGTVTAADRKILLKDFTMLKDKASAASGKGLSSGAECGLRLAVVGLAAFVTWEAAVALEGTWAAVSAITGIFGGGTALEAWLAGIGVGGHLAIVSSIVTATIAITDVGRDQFNKTVTVCKDAVGK